MKKQPQKPMCIIADDPDIEYLKAISTTLPEWNSEHDEKAYLFSDE